MLLRSNILPETHRMQLKTILNHVEKHKSFVYDEARLVEDGDRQRIGGTLRARKNGQPLCGEWKASKRCRRRTCGFWRGGPGVCRGRRWPWCSAPPGTTCFVRCAMR